MAENQDSMRELLDQCMTMAQYYQMERDRIRTDIEMLNNVSYSVDEINRPERNNKGE